MKSVFTAAIAIAAVSFSSFNAYAFPMQVSNVTLACESNSQSSSEIYVEVFAATQASPLHRVKVSSAEGEVIAETEVQENFGEKTSSLESENLRLDLRANTQGRIQGKLTLRNNEGTVFFPVTCQKFYQIMKSAELE